MTCTDVVKIIKACGESNVQSLKFGELELEFGKEEEVAYTTDPIHIEPIANMPIDHDNTVGYNDIEDDDTQEEIDGIPVDQAIDELKFTDPEAWDKLAQAGEV